MLEKKLYLGLENLEMNTRYNIGYFDIDFADGNLVFQVYITPCQTEGCRCDHVGVELVTEGTKLTAWYTRDKEWQDEHRQPVTPDLLQVLQIIENTEMFQERYLHLAYLRRKYVLGYHHREADPFLIQLPRDLVPDHGKGLGHVAIALQGKEKAYPWELSFCADQTCFCFHINLAIKVGAEEWSFWIDKDNQITANDQGFSTHLLAKLRQRLKNNQRFWKLVEQFRSERELENYHRFVKQYQQLVSTRT